MVRLPMAYAKSAVSSQQIIDAAIRVLARRGYARTSLLDIAKEAGVPVGNVYYYFKTRDELGDAVIAARMAQFAGLRARLGVYAVLWVLLALLQIDYVWIFLLAGSLCCGLALFMWLMQRLWPPPAPLCATA